MTATKAMPKDFYHLKLPSVQEAQQWIEYDVKLPSSYSSSYSLYMLRIPLPILYHYFYHRWQLQNSTKPRTEQMDQTDKIDHS